MIDDPSLACKLMAVHKASEGDDVADAEVSMLLALQHLIVCHSDRPGPTPYEGANSRSRLALYRDIIEADLPGNIALGRLAEAAGVTRYQVIRDFKRLTGLTPGGFMRNRRLRHACRVIAEGSDLADAALAAGYADQSHLSREFRRMHGITPGTFRRAWANDAAALRGRVAASAGVTAVRRD